MISRKEYYRLDKILEFLGYFILGVECRGLESILKDKIEMEFMWVLEWVGLFCMDSIVV